MQDENFNQDQEKEEMGSDTPAPDTPEVVGKEPDGNADSPTENDGEPEIIYAPPYSEPPKYVYHWDAATDGAKPANVKTKQKGYLTFAITMCVAFLIALSALVIVLMFAPDGSALPSYTALYEQCAPYTVSIETDSGSIGSGFFITESGRLLTNQHVVGNSSTVTVRTYDGKSYTGKVIGFSKSEDIAVVDIVQDNAILGTTFHAAKIANSSHVKTGDPVIAIGCPAKSYLGWTMTVGYVSNAARTFSLDGSGKTFIQFDAPVNPGNSGGPLINANGEVIGIIQSKASENKYVYDINNNVIGYVDGTYEGLGFAIPSNSAMETADKIVEKYEADPNAPKPQLGITGFQVIKDTEYFIKESTIYRVYTDEVSGEKYIWLQSNNKVGLTKDVLSTGELISAGHDGIWVSGITEGSGAVGKLQKNDLLIEIDGVPIDRSQLYFEIDVDFMSIVADVLSTKEVGDTVTVKVIRNGETLSVSLTLTKKAE